MAAYTTIDDPEAYFQAKTYTGTGSSNALTFDGDTDMQPDLVWIKSRSDAQDHKLHDSVRGTNGGYYESLRANSNAASDVTTDGAADNTGMSTIGSDGFTVISNNSHNGSSKTYVAWCWKESATAGFDIVAYEGAGVGTETNVSHSLSAVPEFYTVKSRESVGNWQSYHHKMSSAPETDYIQLDGTGAVADYTFWGDTAPTSSVFTVDDGDDVNAVEDYITYLWRGVQGYSKFGSYTGNGNADGPFIYLGFRPAWIMTKITSGTDNWQVCDNKRDINNPVFSQLMPDSSDAQNDGDAKVDFLSNGFKIRKSGGSWNGSGSTFIYMAFAEAPFVNSEGVPCNAR